MTTRIVLASLAGLSLGAAATGASNAITAMPAPLIVAFGVSGAVLALAQKRHRCLASALLACGFVLGTTLPRSAPQISGAVVTHWPGGSQRGDLFELLDQIDADPRALLGRRVTVSGEWSPAVHDRAATVSRRVMTCCAADAIRVGFDVVLSRPMRLSNGSTVRASGVLHARLRDGDIRYVIDEATVHPLGCGALRRGSP